MSGRRGAERVGYRSRAIRRGLLLACFLVGGTLITARAAQLQIVEHERWLAAAEGQHREQVELPARRGAIFDREGVPLAISHEMYQVSIAPGELRNPQAAVNALATGLGRSEDELRRMVSGERRWVVLPGRYTAEQRRRVGAIRGVYFDRSFDRFYPQGDAGREVIGAVTRDGRALGGIEQQLDAVLRGEAGYTVLRRNARGQAQPAMSLPVVPPVDGASVFLTIDFDLQEIADVALREAIAHTGSRGGDLLIGDPHTGEILAAASRRGGQTRSLSAITEPFEPGSTLKPFLVATLLTEQVASLRDSVYAERGVWVDGRRTFRDTSPREWLTLDAALEVSSNIALVKFADRLTPGQQFSYLRDFGFGTLTGIDYPAESSGLLRRPSQWSRLSSGSLAMGYELSVTPLQLLAAYGALANGGVLMEPHLVREIRAPDGRTLERRAPTPLRRVIPAEVAAAVTGVLAQVVSEGTAGRAALETFSVAGKTGTSRRLSDGGYAPGSYISTFAGYFPAEDPQIVILVKLDEPQGEYYGGLTAAPVSRETLRGILATRTPGIDLRSLLATRAGAPAPPREERGDLDHGLRLASAVPPPNSTRHVLFVGDVPPAPPAQAGAPVTVPDLRGFDPREAARRAHAAGLRVSVRGVGRVLASDPAPGGLLPQGGLLTLELGEES